MIVGSQNNATSEAEIAEIKIFMKFFVEHKIKN